MFTNSSITTLSRDSHDCLFHRCRAWQNLFIVDGMSMNNDLDPGNTNDNFAEISGRSQGPCLVGPQPLPKGWRPALEAWPQRQPEEANWGRLA